MNKGVITMQISWAQRNEEYLAIAVTWLRLRLQLVAAIDKYRQEIR